MGIPHDAKETVFTFWVHLVPLLHRGFLGTAKGFTVESFRMEMNHPSNCMTHCLLGSPKLVIQKKILIPIQLLISGNEFLNSIGSTDSMMMQVINIEQVVL